MIAAMKAFLEHRSARVAAGALFTAGLVVLMMRSVSLEQLAGLFARLHLPTALLVIVFYVLVTLIRGWRYRVAGATVSFRRAFQIAAVHSALLRVMPLRSGELAYGILMKQTDGSSFVTGMASLLLLRILDLAVILPLAAVVSVLTLAGSVSRAGMGLVLLMGLVLFGLLWLLMPMMSALGRFVNRRNVDTGLKKKLARLVDAITDAFDLSWQRYVSLVGITVLMWASLLLSFHFAFVAIGAIHHFEQGIAASLLGFVGSILPLSLIGSFGPMEGGLALGLTLLGQNQESAFSNALVVSTLLLVAAFVVALPSFVVLTLELSAAKGNRLAGRLLPFFGGVAFAALGGMFLVYKIPYGFETNDQFQYFLLPYRSIYPDFLPGDWFTWQTSHYHLTFSWVIRGLHALFGESGFPTAVFGVHVIVLAGLAFACLRLARAMGAHFSAAFFPLLVVGFVSRMGMAGATVNHGVLLPADMALPLFLLALSFWMEKRPVGAGLFLGLAGFIHANYAVLGPLVIAVPEAVSILRTRKLKSTLVMIALFLAVASPTLFGTIRAFLSKDAAPEALQVLFDVRSPHHYNPVIANAPELYLILALVLLALPVWLERRRGGFRHTAIIAALIGAQVLAALATAAQQPILVRLFFWRLSLPVMLVGSVGVGDLFAMALRKRDASLGLFALSAVIIVAAFSANGRIALYPTLLLSGFGWMMPALLVMLGAVLLDRAKPRIIRNLRYVCTAFPAIFAVLISGSLALAPAKDRLTWQGAEKRWQQLYPIDAKRIAGEKRTNRVYQWIARHTPPTARFLIPPGTDGFRFEARRAVFVDWKCCPMKGEEIKEWQRRMLAAMGVKRFLAKGYALHRVSNLRYHARSLQTLATLARREGLTHILAKKRTAEQDAGLKRLFTRDGWTVYAVAAPSEAAAPKQPTDGSGLPLPR